MWNLATSLLSWKLIANNKTYLVCKKCSYTFHQSKADVKWFVKFLVAKYFRIFELQSGSNLNILFLCSKIMIKIIRQLVTESFKWGSHQVDYQYPLIWNIKYRSIKMIEFVFVSLGEYYGTIASSSKWKICRTYVCYVIQLHQKRSNILQFSILNDQKIKILTV